MKELFTIQVQVTYDLVLYCEREDVQALALESYANERGNEDIDTFGPYPVKKAADLPGPEYLDSLPYCPTGESDEKTVRELLTPKDPPQ